MYPKNVTSAEDETLILDGAAVAEAHFNLQPRRNAASVHLFYPIPPDTKVSVFYCEMTGLEDPLWTYYMACGWHRGYFGMQVNSPTERRIIFSENFSGRNGHVIRKALYGNQWIRTGRDQAKRLEIS